MRGRRVKRIDDAAVDSARYVDQDRGNCRREVS